jgi:hypothetical protein
MNARQQVKLQNSEKTIPLISSGNATDDPFAELFGPSTQSSGIVFNNQAQIFGPST